jgi:dTDP-4-dehydrorhamnose reductase
MKVLIFGATGMLGHKLVQVLNGRFEVWATCRKPLKEFESHSFFDADRILSDVDVTVPESFSRTVEIVAPDVVVNAVGVVKQLPAANNVINTLTINSIFPQRLLLLAERYGFRVITVSTDCVFSGTKGNYGESDTPDALDLYGQSKHWGEIAEDRCLTIRSSIIGHEIAEGHSLLEWIIGNRGGRVDGYSNAVFSGFPTVVFAGIIADLIEKWPSLNGLFHISSDPISKLELLRLINDRYELGIEIIPRDEPRIDRSLDSSKYREVTGFAPLSWPEMIEIMHLDSQLFGIKT